MNSIKNSLLISFLPFFLFANQTVFNWESMTSLINSNSITQDDNGYIIGATSGGIISLGDEVQIMKSFLNDIDLSLIGVDNKNLIWAISNSPNTNIQVFDSNYNLVYNSIYALPNLESIIDLQFSDSKVFVIYTDQNDIGLLEFNYENNIPYYLDYYNSGDFPESINQITDIDLYDDNIYVTTDKGVFVANFNESNLNFSSSWSLIPFDVFIDNIEILFIHRIEAGFYLITDSKVYFCSTDFIATLVLDFESSPIDIKGSNYSNLFCTSQDCYYLNNSDYELLYSCDEYFFINDYYLADDYLFLAINNGGLAKIDISEGSIEHFIPNTLLQNSYDAITILNDGSLAGVTKSHGFIYNDNHYNYFIAEQYADLFPIPLLSLNDNFSFTVLDYQVGDKMIWSIIQNEFGNIMFNNSGIKPDIDQGKGAIIEINPNNFELFLYDSSKTEFMQSVSYPFGSLDGLYGISNEDVEDKYMVTHQIKKDSKGNVWVVNPFSEEYNHPVSVQLSTNNQHWMHIFSEDEVSYVPTEIAFDKYNRGWIGFKNESTNNNCCTNDFSDGGIKVFQYTDTYLNNIDIENYDSNVFWLNPSNTEDLPYGEDSTVWSLDIGSSNNQEILWVLTPQGAQGYILNNTQLLEIYPIPFYTNMGFQQGDKIRSDAQNNAWIVTRHDGVRVIKSDASLWPNGDGFTYDNSQILSDFVYDIAFDNLNGVVYLATEGGISILEVPYSTENGNEESLYVTPQPFVIPSENLMVIKKILSGSDVKILTINGRVLKHFNNLEYNQNIIHWDGRDDRGDYLSTGIYYILSYKDGKSISKKIAIIRK